VRLDDGAARRGAGGEQVDNQRSTTEQPPRPKGGSPKGVKPNLSLPKFIIAAAPDKAYLPIAPNGATASGAPQVAEKSPPATYPRRVIDFSRGGAFPRTSKQSLARLADQIDGIVSYGLPPEFCVYIGRVDIAPAALRRK
jgi:hypothetical protein